MSARPTSLDTLDDLLADPDLARLDAIVPAFDPLEVLAWTRRERAHTRFLAWLLDPRDPRPGGGHGLGTAFLHALVTHAVRSIETLPGTEPDALPRDPDGIDPSTVRVVREQPVAEGQRAPDVRCTWTDRAGREWVMLVENKIDAAEGDGQVREYLAWARARHPDAHRILVYVTPDGRFPDSLVDGEVVVPLAWPDVAGVARDVLERSGERTDPAARAFVTSVLDSLRARFGGDATVRGLVEALYDRHPRACALASSPWAEEVAPLRKRFPRAAYHLRCVRPRVHAWTRAWTERVAYAFGELAGGVRLVPGAPHVDCPDVASWSIDGVTQSLGLYVLCTPGAAFGSARPRVWAGLRAPGVSARELFMARDQLAVIEALPAPTRAFLLDAAPVHDTPGTWRWLCAGAPAVLPRGWSADDDARRVARVVGDILRPHLPALTAFAADPAQRLYSCDLDADHVLPVDMRDREDLARSAHADAERVLILTRPRAEGVYLVCPRLAQRDASPARSDDRRVAALREGGATPQGDADLPRKAGQDRVNPLSGHMHDLRRESDLGVALGAAFGGTGTLVYEYSYERFERPTVVVAATSLFRSPCAEALRAMHDALSGGAALVLLGDRGDPRTVHEALGELVSPVTFSVINEEFPVEGAELVSGETDTFAELARRDGRLIGGALRVRVDERAQVALSFVARGERFPLVAAWRAGGARVVLWAGGAIGPWGRLLRARPEAFGQWWRVVVGFARGG